MNDRDWIPVEVLRHWPDRVFWPYLSIAGLTIFAIALVALLAS